jgi:hypothetical protein
VAERWRGSELFANAPRLSQTVDTGLPNCQTNGSNFEAANLTKKLDCARKFVLCSRCGGDSISLNNSSKTRTPSRARSNGKMPILINVVQPGCFRFSINVVSFSRNVVLSPLFSLNSVSKPRILSVRADYVLSSLQLVDGWLFVAWPAAHSCAAGPTDKEVNDSAPSPTRCEVI